jgi:hypothetical protein
MPISYTLDWTDDAFKQPFVLAGETLNTSTTSEALTGKGLKNWGERIQEDLLRLLEHFASNNGTPPANPTIGQFWWDHTTARLKAYSAAATWTDVDFRRIDSASAPGGVHYPGELWYDTTNDVLKVYTNGATWVLAGCC